ncbi:hypothetical protein PHLCEN_2v425 [Hermanssonia centrifuga]|uniref:glucose-6-phosphate 1-epimerase n=1 Tax=Hermanssonia centrifuga TaxID=98765 RepID=A0A2R6S642_9APHY|nr:hypothetical protein PHLCEN_2v425 [Hermanssonia centrifuga]
MPVEQLNDRILLKHPKGSSAEILLYGASVISWKSGSISNPTPRERLFVSGKSALDGSKAVRGGIPVVFPCFGAPSHPDHAKLSQHGFARSEKWNFGVVVMDNDAGVSVRLTLLPNEGIKEKFEQPFQLDYVVTLAEHQLSTDLHVKNTGLSTAGPINFQALFHNYILAPANEVLVTPLQGVSYHDKVAAADKVETRAAVDVRSFTDSVYENAPGKYQVTWPGGGVEVRTQHLKDVVVWNPQKEAGSKIGDMEEGGW